MLSGDVVGQLARAGADIFGSIWTQRGLNQRFEEEMRQRLAAGENILDYVQQNNLPPGYLQNAYQQILQEYFNNNQNYQNQFNGLQDMFYSGIGDYRNNFDKINTPNYDNSVLQYLRSTLEEDRSRTNPAIEQFLQIAQNGGKTPQTEGLFDTFMQHGSTANPYIANLVDIGGNLLQTGGMTPYSQNALDTSGYFFRNAGMDGNTQTLFDAGFQNRDTAAQGLGLAQGVMNQGQQNINFGQNLINNAQQTGGWDANGQAQFQTGMQGIAGMRDFYNQDPMSVLGATGQQAIQGLMNNPFTQQGFDTTQGVLNNFLQRPDISQNDQNIINASMGGAFGISPMQLQNMGIAQGIAGQDVNALPDWFGDFMTQGNNLMSQIGSSLGGAISGGGGGGSVSYSPMSRDLGPVDPKIQASLEKALAEFEKNPLLSDAEVTGFARDQAATSAKNQALAAQKRAVMMGGAAPTVWGGGQDGALRSFADEAMQLESKSIQDALMKNAELKLARSGQQSDMAKALAAIKAQREDLFGRMNMADASNALQASTANAQLADSAAGRSLQAQIANSANQRALAELQASLFSTLLGNATTQRGQNTQSQVAGVSSLADIMNAISGSQSNYLKAMSDAAARGQAQYNTNAGAITDLTGQLGQYGTQRNTGLATALGALGDASGQLTSRGNNMMDNFTSLVTGAGNNATSRYGAALGAGADIMGTGMSGMTGGLTGYNAAMNNMNNAMGISQGALGAANDRLGHYADIFRTASTDATNRMDLGAKMTGQGLDALRGFLDSAAGVTKQQQDYAAAMGTIGSNLYRTNTDAAGNYGNTAVGFANNDTDNRKLLNDSFLGFLNSLNTGIANNNTAWGLANAPYAGILGQQLNYLGGTQSLMGNYSGLFGRG